MLSVSVSDSLMFQVYLCCSIDATNNARLGRYTNDAPMRRMECNCLSKACYINKKPHLLVSAARDIQEGEELRYDYGTGNLPWRIKNPDSATVVTSASDQIMSENPNKQQSVSVENLVASTSGAKSASENPNKQQSVSVENPVASTSGAKSTSENPKKQQNPNKQQSVSVENPVASTSGAKSASENPNKQQSLSVENPVASTSGSKSASENLNKQQSVSVENPVASTSGGKSTSENPKKQQNPNKQQSVSVENPVASTSGAKSTSENPKKKQNPNKQQSVSVESQVASTADGAVVLNSTFNTIEAGLYYVHSQTGILHPYEEMEDADEFPLRDDDVEYFGQSAPLVSFQF